MPYLPPPEAPQARRRREAREARAAELGCPMDALLLVERMERLQEDLREVEEAAARCRAGPNEQDKVKVKTNLAASLGSNTPHTPAAAKACPQRTA